jgi:hypothetical protein
MEINVFLLFDLIFIPSIIHEFTKCRQLLSHHFFVQCLPVSKLLQFLCVHFLGVNCSVLSPHLTNDSLLYQITLIYRCYTKISI